MTTHRYKVKPEYDKLMEEYNRIAVRYMLGDKSLEQEYNEITTKIEAMEDGIYSKIEMPEGYEPEPDEFGDEADYEYDKWRDERDG